MIIQKGNCKSFDWRKRECDGRGYDTECERGSFGFRHMHPDG